MKKITMATLAFICCTQFANSQTSQKPQQEITPEDVVRIRTDLVQTDVVVVDKNDQPIKDLKLEDFELYDNGKKQALKVAEFINSQESVPTQQRTASEIKATVESTSAPGLSAKDVKRVVAFVIDDLTIEVEDLTVIRNTLLNFVNNKMQDGDLVAIVRVIGGKGLLQQFTSDRQLLRRAIAAIGPVAHPFANSNLPDQEKLANPLAPVLPGSPTDSQPEAPEIYSANDDLNRFFRGLSALTTANFVVNSLRDIPGHKNLVIISAGIPIFETGASGSNYSNITALLNQLSDNAMRAGVVINTLDPRGLRATPGVVGFNQTPGRSALGGGGDPSFGRGSTRDQAVFGPLLAGGSEHLGLSTIAAYTGGVSIVNTNNFDDGLQKILARSNGYYLLAYTPGEPFDNKFHKLEVKVKASGAKVYNHARYLATEEKSAKGPRTKEEEIAAAARSPLTRREIDVTPSLGVKFENNKATVGVNLLIAANALHFNDNADKLETSLDVVGFVFDQLGKLSTGFSETINLKLSAEQYRRALMDGIPYSTNLELPPGYYQLRSVVRESSSGNLGTFSKYLEIPDLTRGLLAVGSIFLFAVDSATNAAPVPLLAIKKLSRKQDLRYATAIYNAKLKNGKPELRSQMIVSQAGKVLFKEPEQAIESNGSSPVVKLGQLVLARVPPGRYTLTVVVTDTLADKKNGTLSRSTDFIVGN
ncbi:MAG TPA: VWA domain-containing protein [Pyrinomonadaceae bacterium]